MYIKRSGYNNAVMKIEKLAVHLLKANISLVKGQGGIITRESTIRTLKSLLNSLYQ